MKLFEALNNKLENAQLVEVYHPDTLDLVGTSKVHYLSDQMDEWILVAKGRFFRFPTNQEICFDTISGWLLKDKEDNIYRMKAYALAELNLTIDTQ